MKVTFSEYLDFHTYLCHLWKKNIKKTFFWKILFHTGFIACWGCAGRQPFVANCSQSEIWKEFSSEGQVCTLIYNACLKDDQKIKSWNIPKYVVVKASLEPIPQNLTKTKSGANFMQLYLPRPSLSYSFFGGFGRPHDCLKPYHSSSVWHSGLL